MSVPDEPASEGCPRGRPLVILGRRGTWHVRQLEAAAHRRGFPAYVASFERLAGEVTGRTRPAEGACDLDRRERPAGTQDGRLSNRSNPGSRHTDRAGSSRECGRYWAGDIGLSACAAVIVRSMPAAGLEPIIFRMDLLGSLAQSGVPVINPPQALEVAIDKYRSLDVLARAGLPVPPTAVAQTTEEAMAAFDRLGGDVVVKPIFGGEGRGIVRITDAELARRAFAMMERMGMVIYEQAFIPHDGYDVRLLVIGDDLFVMARSSDDWRTNVSRGAEVRALDVPLEWKEAARVAARAVGAPLLGVDLLPARRGGWYVLEVNAVPGWRAMQQVVSADLADRIVGLVLGREAEHAHCPGRT